jgi:hypothetical protein
MIGDEKTLSSHSWDIHGHLKYSYTLLNDGNILRNALLDNFVVKMSQSLIQN